MKTLEINVLWRGLEGNSAGVTIYEVKYNYTAVMVGQALRELLAYSELLKDEEIFRVFYEEVKKRTSKFYV